MDVYIKMNFDGSIVNRPFFKLRNSVGIKEISKFINSLSFISSPKSKSGIEIVDLSC